MKLKIDSEEDAEYVVAKEIRNGDIEAQLVGPIGQVDGQQGSE